MTETPDRPEQDRERLEELEEHIEAAREDAEKAEEGPLHSEQRFYESGSVRPDLDDQTIAPPG